MGLRIFQVVACLTVLTLASCNRRVTPQPVAIPQASSGVVQPDGGEGAIPFCSVESRREHDLQDGVQLQVWNLKGSGLKGLAGRLYVVADGKAELASTVEYKWDKWGLSAPAATGQLLLLIQDGRAFGVKGKRLPSLALDLQSSPSHSRTLTRAGRFLEGDLQSRMTHASYSTPLGRKSVLFAQLFLSSTDALKSASLGSDLESAVAASRGGRTVLAVELEWTPQE